MIPVTYEMTTVNMHMFSGFKLVAKAVMGGFMCDGKSLSWSWVAFSYSDT